MKYEIGDFVSKPVTGICKIEDVLSMDPMGGKNTKLYYLMKPVEDEKEKIYVAVSNADEKMRSCLTEEEAWDLIVRIPEISMEWKANERMREQEYKEAVKSNDPEVFVGLSCLCFLFDLYNFCILAEKEKDSQEKNDISILGIRS